MITRKRTGACPKYLPTPLHELRVDQMCVPDLYAFIKLYGREVHVLELTSLLKLRRNRLVRLYRDVLENPQRPMISTFFGRRDFERNVDFNGINMGNEIYYPRNNNRNNNNQPPNNGPGQGNGRAQQRGGNNNVPLQGGNNRNNNQPPNNGPGGGNGRVQQGNGMEVEIINPVQTGINNRQRNNMVEGNGMEVEIINPAQTGINNHQRQQRIKWRAPKIEDMISLLTRQKNGPRSSVQGTRRSSRIPPRSQSLLTYRQNGQSNSRQNGQSSSRQNGLRLPETRSQGLLTNGLQGNGSGQRTGLTVQQRTRQSPRIVPVQSLLTYRQNGQSSSRQNGPRLSVQRTRQSPRLARSVLSKKPRVVLKKQLAVKKSIKKSKSKSRKEIEPGPKIQVQRIVQRSRPVQQPVQQGRQQQGKQLALGSYDLRTSNRKKKTPNWLMMSLPKKTRVNLNVNNRVQTRGTVGSSSSALQKGIIRKRITPVVKQGNVNSRKTPRIRANRLTGETRKREQETGLPLWSLGEPSVKRTTPAAVARQQRTGFRRSGRETQPPNFFRP